MAKFDNFIGGEWVAPRTGEYAPNINPANLDETVGHFASSGPEDAARAIDAAARAADDWAALPGPQRGSILYSFAELLKKHEWELGEALSKEEGKPIKEAIGEVTRARAETLFMAGEASRIGGEHYESERPGVDVTRRRVPLGPIGVITPWNFPIVTPVRKISPAIAYGDTVVFKPATLTPWCAVKLVELYAEAGVPKGVINLVTGPGSAIGSAIAKSPLIRGITFTGSTAVGRQIYRDCAENLAKVQLEMGGKNPALVFDAADLKDVASQIVTAAFASAGQRCTAISRVIVSEREHDELVELMRGLIAKMRVGDPLSDASDMGPLVSRDQMETMNRYMGIAASEKVKIVIGGTETRGPHRGYYFLPTLLDGVQASSPLAREEIFGPILSVITVKSFEEGLAVSNEPVYGLAGCVFTRYIDRAKQFADRMQAGMIHVNHGTASQPHVPFGGVKQSGFGAYSIGPTSRDFYMADKVVYFK